MAIPAGFIEILPRMKYEFAIITSICIFTLDKYLTIDNLAKVRSQWAVKYRPKGHGSCN